MTNLRRPMLSFLFSLLLFSTVLAQQLNSPSTMVVTTTTAAGHVRFAAPSSVVQIRVEIYDAAGVKVFDNEVRGGNVLDWHLQNGQADHVSDGSYLCVVTVKSSSGRINQKLGTVTIATDVASLEPTEGAGLSRQQSEAVGPIEEGAALTVLKEGETQTPTVVAHNGTDGQIVRGKGALSFRLGDFYSGQDLEQMRLTEEGNLGVGTDNPQAKLDVAGVIRTSKGIEFANPTDGTNVTRLTTTAAGTLEQTLADGTIVTNATGTGSQDKIPKWAETGGAGTLTDSVISETAGKVGIGITNPTYKLVIGPDIGPGLTTSDLTISRGAGQSVSIFAGASGANGMNFGWDQGNLRAFVNAPVQSPITFTHGGVSERMRIDTNGNIGIDKTAPGQLLHLNVTSGHGEGMQIDSAIAGHSPAIYLNHTGPSGRNYRIASFGDNTNPGRFVIRDDTAAADRLVINSSGAVLIRGLNPIASFTGVRSLEVNGAIGVIDGAATIHPGGISTEAASSLINFGMNDDSANRFGGTYGSTDQGGLLRVDTRSGQNLFQFLARAAGSTSPVSEVMGLSSTGTLTVTGNVCAANISCTSDARLKKNIKLLSYGLREVMQLRPVSWQWKDNTDAHLNLGMVAQEVAPVLPELVLRGADVRQPLGLNYMGLIPVLVKAAQEQQAHIEAQLQQKQALIERLEARLAALEMTVKHRSVRRKPRR